MSENTVRSVITPNDQFIRSVFDRAKAFHIDIYQREYRWEKAQIDALLEDIELRFNCHKRTKIQPKDIQKEVLKAFEPYYLNTFLTNAEPTATAIVDGQQRLTTLLLILIKLQKILLRIEENRDLKGKTFSSEKLEKLILERDDFGDADRFKIFNKNREEAFRSIVDENQDFIANDETQSRIIENYKVISNYFEKFLKSNDESVPYDYIKLTYYICYLLDRISIVEIKIEQQKSVAMIFEVVNDRGLGLTPHEILKGKFIGSLPKEQKEKTNNTWIFYLNEFFKKKIPFDDFLQTYFRAKFADGKTDYDKFSNEKYHYELYKNKNSIKQFNKFLDTELLFKFVEEDFKYFAELFLTLNTSYKYEYVFYNRLNKQNQQYLLILSAIKFNDNEKEKKINLVSKKFDQLFSILSLLKAYDSRDIQLNIQDLNLKLREKSLEEVEMIFDAEILNILKNKEKIQEIPDSGLNGIFRYELFKSISNTSPDFSKYILMRIDRYITEKLDLPSYINVSLQELQARFRTRRKYGLHLEHILAHNKENHGQFEDKDTGQFDDAHFNVTRNLLGMLLLLKDRQNESSNNENYTKKFTRYSTSDFVWNRLLVGHLDIVDERSVPESWNIEVIRPTEKDTFPINKISLRQRAIFKLIKEIWDF